jgi:hypothetical protein
MNDLFLQVLDEQRKIQIQGAWESWRIQLKSDKKKTIIQNYVRPTRLNSNGEKGKREKEGKGAQTTILKEELLKEERWTEKERLS